MSYRAQNLHAEIFLWVLWSLDRSKVPKVSKNHDFDDFLKGQKGGKNGDNPHCGVGALASALKYRRWNFWPNAITVRGYRHFYYLFDLSKNHQNHGFYSLWELLTYLTTIKLIKISLHANSELCSSHTALFQAIFIIF